MYRNLYCISLILRRSRVARDTSDPEPSENQTIIVSAANVFETTWSQDNENEVDLMK